MTTQSDFSEADLNKVLDEDIDSLVDNFGRIINSGFVRQRNGDQDVKNKLELAQEEHVITDSAANIVATVESLLRFTGEMKQALLNKDYRLMNTYAAIQSEKIETAKDRCVDSLDQIHSEIASLTRELEEISTKNY